jgi:NAD(P)H-hydrate epimerase
VFVIAGSRGFTGAAKLAGLAAARAGAGLVTVGVPRPLSGVVASGLMEVMTLGLRATRAESIALEAAPEALKFARDKSAVALGPGLSQQPSTQKFVQRFVGQCASPMVIDADGLNALAGRIDVLREVSNRPILTPHPGEMARLCGTSTAAVQADRETVAGRFAREHRCVVVLKGHRTVVAGEDGAVYVNPTGNAGMATGGTGDVLTGLLGGRSTPPGSACTFTGSRATWRPRS